MSVPVLTFFNNKGSVGKTSLVYHLAWMFAEQGKRVLTCDLDPQANLTAAFLGEDQIAELWDGESPASTIYRCIEPLVKDGELLAPELQMISPTLALIPGDLALTGFEDLLSGQWSQSMNNDSISRSFRILSAFWQVAQMGAQQHRADLILVDAGANLGAINHSALIASDYFIVPLGADLFSLQGLRNLGPTLQRWRSEWQERVENWPVPEFDLPSGMMKPLGYVVQQYGVQLSRPVKANDQWVNRIPSEYRRNLLSEGVPNIAGSTSNDPECLATLKHYRSLISLGQEHRKPIFKLTSSDGAIGSHALAAREAYSDFSALASRIQSTMDTRAATG